MSMDWLTNSALIQDAVVLFRPALFNLYFASISIALGFPLAIGLAIAKAHPGKILSRVAGGYILFFRGSPLFIQLFMFYSMMLSFNTVLWKPLGVADYVLHPLFIGPLVLILNTSAYSAEIFHGALKSIPKNEIEAAQAMGMNKVQIFRTVRWPNMIRLGWPAYTNEAVFLFHSTTLVYFALPVINDQKDLLNKAGELFERDYNLFLHFSVAGLYFLVISMFIFWLAGMIYKRLNRHLNFNDGSLAENTNKIPFSPNYMR